MPRTTSLFAAAFKSQPAVDVRASLERTPVGVPLGLDPGGSHPWESAYHGLHGHRRATATRPATTERGGRAPKQGRGYLDPDASRTFPTLWGTPWDVVSRHLCKPMYNKSLTAVVALTQPLCVAGPRSTSWSPATPCCGAHVPRLRYAAAASLTSGSSPAEWICRSMRRMRRCRRRYQRAASRFRWWGRWLEGEGDPDGVVQPSPGTPSLPNSSTGSSSACSPPPSACSSRRLIGRELERLVDSTAGRAGE